MHKLTQAPDECLITCCAMLLDCGVEVLRKELELAQPAVIHIQEAQDLFYRRHQMLAMIQPWPCLGYYDAMGEIQKRFPFENAGQRFLYYLSRHNGIIITRSPDHAVVWWENQVVDPNNKWTDIKQFIDGVTEFHVILNR